MKGKSVFAESRELAFRCYQKCGGNVEATLRELEKEGLKLSKPTLYDWMEKFNFKARLKNADAVVQEAADIKQHYREKILADLKKQKERYDKFFEGLAESQIDTQATYAYNSLCKTISDIQRDLDAKPDLYRMAPLVMDAFVQFVKKTVKEKPSQELVFGLIDRFFDEVKPE
jgi:predicted nucleotide-binding protein (sugar kinase/HSP70/actin superfamily)